MPELSQPLQHGSSEASIDQVNIWMRGTPWYQQQMRAWGQDPGHPTLTKNQSQQILRMAQANGVRVDEGDVELDDHGNFNPKGHKLRNTLIVAGIAAATIATMGAAGAFSAAAPGAAAASGTSAAAAGSVGAGTAAGLGAAALPGAMATLPAIGAGAGTAAIVGGGAAAAHGGLGASLMTFGGSTLASTLARSFTDVYAANKQIDAANHSADLQLQSNREALAFQQREADRQRAVDETNRRANYEQWAVQQRRHNTLGQMLGYGPLEIPAYVPLDASTPGAAPSAGGAAGAHDPRIADVLNTVTQGLAPTSQNLDVVIKALNDAGIKASRATHAGGVASDDFINFDGGGGMDVIQNVGSANAKWQQLIPAAAPARLGTLGQIAGAPQRATPTTAIAPGVVMPSAYRPRTLGDYAGAY